MAFVCWRVSELMTLIVALVVILVSSLSVNCESDGNGEWQILTKQNFSSQIRLHPNILLLVSVPWSGESRILMKEISRRVVDRGGEFGFLKLMHIHGNKEKMLTDAIGVKEGITVTIVYYHHSFPYKYQGKLVASNILSSILPYMSVSPQQIPIKGINTEEELNAFLESTDKALLLLEFCGWTPKLLATKNTNGTENGTGLTDRIRVSSGKEDQKEGIESASLNCGVQDGMSGIPWLIDEFSSGNDSASLQDTENIKPSVGLPSCTFEEFQRFDSFFSGLMSMARELFLPSERYRFGVVSERSLLSSLGIGDSGSWLTVLCFNGCPSCSKIVKEVDDLKTVLLINESIVKELEGDGQDLDPAVPSNKPSLLLFVDRFSESAETKRRSKEALDTLRKLAVQYQISDQRGQQDGDKSERSDVQATEENKSKSGHPRLKLSPVSQKIKLNEKMSIMIVNDGKHAILEKLASDSEGSSLREILTHFLQQKKEGKLSSVAKEMGFQLLSNDVDIKLTDELPSEAQVESTEDSSVPYEEILSTTSVHLDVDSASSDGKRSQTTDIRYSSQDDECERIYVDTSGHLLSVKPDQLVLDEAISGVKAEEIGSTKADQSEEDQLHFQGFKGSFFFSDGNYRLLRALTDETRIPSLVIIDPILQQHYVFPWQTIFSYSSMEDFLYGYLNGILTPYQRSETKHESPREGTHPPFVNLDFHEVDSIPRITVQTFSEQVLGFNQSDSEIVAYAWKEDVLVLFSNSWCGFCQRMELVVREVYRAIKGYTNILKTGSWNGDTVLSENLKNGNLKLPKIYFMDCTLNDCSLILKSRSQRDVYPSLLLFPAERKTAVSYEGVMAVTDVIKFIADHGSSSQHLTSEKGILWSVAENYSRNHLKNGLLTSVHREAPIEKDKFHEVLLKNLAPKRTIEYSQTKSHTSERLHETVPHVVVGSILVATERLSMQLFVKSIILIVKAEKDAGFQGLIYNKPISWDSLDSLEQGLELLKEAHLSFGGPLIKRGMPLVALTRRMVKDQYPEVASGIYFLDQSATLKEIEELKSGNHHVADYWFFLGFSSWGWNQLLDEIADGTWSLNANNAGLLDWP